MLIDDSHVVNLNVGGKDYATTVATLNTFPNSLLAKMVSAGTGAARVDDKGNYFIDRDGELFRHILNFLREPEDFFSDPNGRFANGGTILWFAGLHVSLQTSPG